MTPAINVAIKNNISHKVHEYIHEPSNKSYGSEAAIKLGVSETEVFKTLIINLDNEELVVAVLPVSSMLNMKALAKTGGAKKAMMADKPVVERVTGYVLGGVSPLGQKKQLKTIIDSSAKHHATIFISAGRRGLEIELNPKDLRKIVNGTYADISQ